ncbi:hypothetical protein Nmel_009284 [Mimus melanotis]
MCFISELTMFACFKVPWRLGIYSKLRRSADNALCLAGPGVPSPRALAQRLDRAPGQALQPAPHHLLRAPRGVGAGAAAAGGAPGGPGQQPALLGTAQPRLPPGKRRIYLFKTESQGSGNER